MGQVSGKTAPVSSLQKGDVEPSRAWASWSGGSPRMQNSTEWRARFWSTAETIELAHRHSIPTGASATASFRLLASCFPQSAPVARTRVAFPYLRSPSPSTFTTNLRARHQIPAAVARTPRCRKLSTSRTRAIRPLPLATFQQRSSSIHRPSSSMTRRLLFSPTVLR